MNVYRTFQRIGKTEKNIRGTKRYKKYITDIIHGVLR